MYHRLYNSLMQGNEAVGNLLAALEKVKQEAQSLSLQAVILIRGGGAQLDLDCFDDYRLGAAIANFPIPVFTGIGHERDETVADLVAHTRLKTPTAVAEFLLSGFRAFEENLALFIQRLDRSTRLQIREEERKIQQYTLRAKSLATSRVSLELEKVKNRINRIDQASKNEVKMQGLKLDVLEKGLKKGAETFVRKQQEILQNRENLLRQLDPESILKRGYTRTELDGKPIHLAQPNTGDQILTFTLHHKISSTITQVEEK